jgi:HK97 gp10 family phage protein
MTETVQIIGMENLKAKFLELAEGLRGDALGRAGKAGMLCIKNAAKIKAPRRTSNLARSIEDEITEQRADYVEVTLGTNLEYAAMQEFGGTIVPKNAKYLAIPLTDEARQFAGGPRSFPRELSPRIKGGKGVMVDEAGVAQFALVKSATIPAHPYLRPAFDENVNQAAEDVGYALRQILEAIAND